MCELNIVLCLRYRLAFFKAAYALFDSDFYVKADDDIYLRPGALISKPWIYLFSVLKSDMSFGLEISLK